MQECSIEHVLCPVLFEPEKTERPTLNVERSIIFCIQYWTFPTRSRRGGRAVDRAGLENRKAERPREFESHPLRSASRSRRFAGLAVLFARSRTPSEASAKEGPVYYVYLIESLAAQRKRYIGMTTDLKQRLQEH